MKLVFTGGYWAEVWHDLTSDLTLTASKMNVIISHVISYLASKMGEIWMSHLCDHLRRAVNKYLLTNWKNQIFPGNMVFRGLSRGTWLQNFQTKQVCWLFCLYFWEDELFFSWASFHLWDPNYNSRTTTFIRQICCIQVISRHGQWLPDHPLQLCGVQSLFSNSPILVLL